MGNRMGLNMGITMRNHMEPSTGIAMGNRMELSMEYSMGFRMGISMDKTMGIKMERRNFSLSAIGLSRSHQATDLRQVPANMPSIS
jgi:hypothetical protein